MSESQIVTAVLEYLSWRKVMAWRSNNTGVFDPVKKCYLSFRGLKGVSDIIGCLPGGQFLAIEAKSGKGKLSAHQSRFLEEVAQLGGKAIIARSVQDVQEAGL